jgi:hypothetical protein
LRFLLDESVSPLVTLRLVAAGHDAVHVHDVGPSTAGTPKGKQAPGVTARMLTATADIGVNGVPPPGGSLTSNTRSVAGNLGSVVLPPAP